MWLGAGDVSGVNVFMCLCVSSILSGGDGESSSSALLNAVFIGCLNFEVHLMRKYL